VGCWTAWAQNSVLELQPYTCRLPKMSLGRSGRVVMSAGVKLTALLVAGILCVPIAGRADTPKTHPVHKVKKPQPPPPLPPLPSGPQGPVPQVPLDAIPAVAPQVSYQGGLLTIVAPNSTLGDILRGVRKHTAADIEVPATATERVVTRLGPGPAREVVAELLNGSHFNYILLGSADDANALVRVVLVAKTGPDNPSSEPAPADKKAAATEAAKAVDAADADAADEAAEDTPEPAPAPAEAEQPPAASPDQPGVKTPQQLLQEMQQRQLQQQPGQPGYAPGRPGAAVPPTPPQTPPDQQ